MRTTLRILAIFTFNFYVLTSHAQSPQVTLSEDLKEATVEVKSPFISVAVPDGNYRVTATLGSKKKKGSTTLRAESRRLMLENVATKRGEQKTFSFVVNKRDTKIRSEQGEDAVRIKPRERTKLNWDDRLTLEISGDAPCVSAIHIEPADTTITTLYLCGNSTVVDQDYEPWASWGQMIPRWLDDRVAVANYAESGETVSTFIGAKRFQKILTLLRKGDYVFIEFGHNDQKQKFAGAGAYYNFATGLKQMADEVRQRGATPVFVTPTQRRSFDDEGHIRETHADYPDAMRWVALREGVQVIELHDATRTFYEQMGVEESKRAFVHYPANTYPNQPKELADNTHFNPYGAYEIAKMVIEGMRRLELPVVQHLRDDYVPYSPLRPDPVESFHWTDSPFYESLKPDGN
ncbi:MAG: rhamnogalacturonan acetylesterase [Bacteroidaceae bacterium]|nr:rhamnogalacturonan acetylesterase [Bacteroidaceae bacterium]